MNVLNNEFSLKTWRNKRINTSHGKTGAEKCCDLPKATQGVSVRDQIRILQVTHQQSHLPWYLGVTHKETWQDLPVLLPLALR